jgi:hypothetical protein
VRLQLSPYKLASRLALFAAVPPCLASTESGSLQDTIANVLAVFVIIVVPVAGIAIFWLVHVLPEKVAERRHHPQKDAIKVLCFLSLVFGGMLWPLAWLWAYSKPVLHKLAYGRDKHDDYYAEPGDDADSAAIQDKIAKDEIARQRFEELEQRRH